MSVLGKRVSRLEGPTSDNLPPIAMLSAPLPAIATDEWAAVLLASYGWSGRMLYVTVWDGPAGLSLKPTLLSLMSAEEERAWLSAFARYPYATILSSPSGVLAKRHDSETEFQRWWSNLEDEVVA